VKRKCTSNLLECFRSGSFRALVEMGVVDTLPADGSSMSAKDLAQKLGVDEALLGVSLDLKFVQY